MYYTASNVLPDLPPVFSLSLCQHIYTLHKRKEDPTAGQLQSLANTELQVVLAMARNLSILNQSKIDPKGGKSA